MGKIEKLKKEIRILDKRLRNAEIIGATNNTNHWHQRYLKIKDEWNKKNDELDIAYKMVLDK